MQYVSAKTQLFCNTYQQSTLTAISLHIYTIAYNHSETRDFLIDLFGLPSAVWYSAVLVPEYINGNELLFLVPCAVVLISLLIVNHRGILSAFHPNKFKYSDYGVSFLHDQVIVFSLMLIWWLSQTILYRYIAKSFAVPCKNHGFSLGSTLQKPRRHRFFAFVHILSAISYSKC